MPYLETYDVSSISSALCEPLTPEAFSPFGTIVSAPHQLKTQKSISANYGTAIKLHKVSKIENNFHLASKSAIANWNIFRCSPPTHLMSKTDDSVTYTAKVLERHPFSSQTFMPMGVDKSKWAYVVVCAQMDQQTRMPIPSTLKAFICKGDQAVTYAAGTWHAPMISLIDKLDFGVMIHENGIADEDCQECLFEPGFKVVIPSFAIPKELRNVQLGKVAKL